jgi:hypothetical protein
MITCNEIYSLLQWSLPYCIPPKSIVSIFPYYIPQKYIVVLGMTCELPTWEKSQKGSINYNFLSLSLSPLAMYNLPL